MYVTRGQAGYTMTAVTTSEAATIFNLPNRAILDLEEAGYLAPNAATQGKLERYYVHDVKQAIIAKASSIGDDSVVVHAAGLKTTPAWRPWLTDILTKYKGLTPKALAEIITMEMESTLPEVLTRTGVINIPGIGLIVMQAYPERKLYVNKTKTTRVIPPRMRAIFRASKKLTKK